MAPPHRVLERPVLVLNRAFEAYTTTTVEVALADLFSGRAEAVDHADPYSYQTYTWADWAKVRPAEGDELVGTTREPVVAPFVIRMKEYDTTPRRGVTCSRVNILKRDGWRCQYCGGKVTGETMTLDHVVPRAQGGTSTWENLATCCYDCNQRKGGRTPRQAGMVLIQKPVKPAWKPEFAYMAHKITSWQKFLSEVYWKVPLDPAPDGAGRRT